jgi:hypothetical protein
MIEGIDYIQNKSQRRYAKDFMHRMAKEALKAKSIKGFARKYELPASTVMGWIDNYKGKTRVHRAKTARKYSIRRDKLIGANPLFYTWKRSESLHEHIMKIKKYRKLIHMFEIERCI